MQGIIFGVNYDDNDQFRIGLHDCQQLSGACRVYHRSQIIIFLLQ